jgi:hypothetical protein
VITDSLFSMDGDFADLRGLAALKRRHNFLLVRQLTAALVPARLPAAGSLLRSLLRAAGTLHSAVAHTCTHSSGLPTHARLWLPA